MRYPNWLLAACFVVCAIFGGIIGGNIQASRDAAEIQAAWDDITVVADGTLVANPSAYAYDPQQLADARNVRIISNSRAAAAAAWDTSY